MNVSGATSAAYGLNASGGVGATGGQRRHQGGGGEMKTIADTLGIATDQLQQDMSSGSSLAQIAQKYGKTANDLINALQAKAKTRLDQAVSAGTISQDQATQLLDQLKQRETSFVNGTQPSGGSGKANHSEANEGGRSGTNDIASLLGVNGFQSGSSGQTTSIGQVLKAYGVDGAGLGKTLIEGITSGLDKAKSAGKLSQAQEDSLLSQVTASLDQAFGTGGATSTDGTTGDLASLLFKQSQSGASGSGGASSYAAMFQANVQIDFAA